MPPGEQGAFHPGGAMLAVKAGVDVLPVAHDAGSYWAKRGFLKKPGVIKVRIGPPIKTEGQKARAVNDEAREWIADTMTALHGAPEKTMGPKKEKTA